MNLIRYNTWTCYRQASNSASYDTEVGTLDLMAQPKTASSLQVAMGIMPVELWFLNTPPRQTPTTFKPKKLDKLQLKWSGEALESGDGSTKSFSGNLYDIDRGILRGSISITATVGGSPVTITEPSKPDGTLSGTGVTGTIDYDTGAYALTFTTAPDADTDIEFTWVAKPEVIIEGVEDFSPHSLQILAKEIG